MIHELLYTITGSLSKEVIYCEEAQIVSDESSVQLKIEKEVIRGQNTSVLRNVCMESNIGS